LLLWICVHGFKFLRRPRIPYNSSACDYLRECGVNWDLQGPPHQHSAR
jgi:hypothetical protein